MKEKLFIVAYNIHSGGGAKLLKGLLESSELTQHDPHLYLDQRFQYNGHYPVNFVRNTIWDRLKIELQISRNSPCASAAFFLGNLPPLFKLKCNAYLLIQNKYLITKHPISEFPLKIRIRISLERAWLRLLKSRISLFVVQTQHMKIALMESLKLPESKIRVLPFYENESSAKIKTKPLNIKKENTSFLYVASAEPHKNHKQLLKAWSIFIETHPGSELFLTINPGLYKKICGVNYCGELDREGINHLYNKCDILIYPSLLESFGLPLIEAVHHGLNVGASNLDFVHEIITPSATFNPYLTADIVKALEKLASNHFAVTQFKNNIKILKPNDFIKELTQNG